MKKNRVGVPILAKKNLSILLLLLQIVLLSCSNPKSVHHPDFYDSHNNTYCSSLKKHNEIEQKIDGCRTVSNIAQLYGSRYYKVNANSFSVHNTVEFRQHSGTIEIERMENWIRFLDALVKYSEREVVSSSDFENLKNFCCPELVESIYGRIQSLNS